MRPQVGQVINNKYRLLRLIGDGGMGSVFEARHEALGTSVALKFLHPELSRRSGLVQRFLQEARVSAQIHSPHVVRVTDVDQTANGLAFIVLEYLEGRTLQTVYEDLYRAGQRLSYSDAIAYASQMIEGVEAAHKTGIVHRDLKPDNVMITTGPKGLPLVKLLDFGIAKLKVSGELERGLTRPGVIMGTPEYMAPEQAFSADAVDARADIFSLGVMMFEMLAGRRPVGGDDPQQIAGAYLAGQIAQLRDLAPAISADLAAVVHHAMAAQPRDRFSTAAELREAMEPFVEAVRITSPGKAPGVATPQPSPVVHAAGAQSLAETPTPRIAGDASANVALPSSEAPRTIPKTLPPDDDDASAPTGHGPMGTATPIGGFGSPGQLTGAAHASLTASPHAIGRTDGGLSNATDFAPFEPQARPGGTALGDGFRSTSGTTPDGQAYVPGLAGTAPMDPGGVRPTAGAVAIAPRRPSRSAPSLAVILALAASVAGAVVGGVYAANHYAKIEDHKDAPIALPAPTTLAAEPPPAVTAKPPPAPPPPVVTPPKPAVTAKPPGPTGTAPAPTGTPPPMLPSAFPPIVIPSAFPFPIPGFPQAGQPQSQTPPQQPPGQTPPAASTKPPAPAPSGTVRPRRIPILVPPRNLR